MAIQESWNKVGSIQIRGLNEMDKRGHSAVAEWLIKQARAIKKDGANYAPKFHARYFIHRQRDNV